MKTLTVQLNPANLELAHRLAILRNGKENMGITTKRFGDLTDERTHYVGLLGEIAVAAYLGVPVDETERLAGDMGVDFLYNGLTIDVKTRTKEGWDMLFYNDWSDLRADLFVLAWANLYSKVITLAGWEWADEIKKVARPMQYRAGNPRWGVRSALLRDMKTIKEWGVIESKNRI